MITLKLRKEFEEALKNYKPSKEAMDTLSSTPLVLMAGLTASGRNTVIEYLAKTGLYKFVKSDTTRPPRIEHGIVEKNGGPYWFKSEEDFLKGLEEQEYFEAAIIHNQQVSGLNISEIAHASEEGLMAITEVTPEGIDTYTALKPTTTCLFFLPPSYEIWLDRLKQRSSMSDQELTHRKQSAKVEITHLLANEQYKIVINEDIEETFHKVRRIVEHGEYTEDDHKNGVKVAQTILSSLKSA
jgi:guanylate kinase